MDSVIKILFFLIFFGVWIVKIAKKFSEMKNTQSRTSYSPQRKEEIPRPAEEFPKLDFEKKQEESQEAIDRLFEQAPEEDYLQPELVEDNIEEIPEEEFKKPVEEKAEKVPEVVLADDSWKSEEVISTLSIGVSDARMGIIMSEILGKPIALR